MSKDTTVEVYLYRVTRLWGSKEGNPRYLLHTSDGKYKTEVNTAGAYGLENNFAIGESINKNVLLTLSKGNKDAVYDWKVIEHG